LLLEGIDDFGSPTTQSQSTYTTHRIHCSTGIQSKHTQFHVLCKQSLALLLGYLIPDSHSFGSKRFRLAIGRRRFSKILIGTILKQELPRDHFVFSFDVSTCLPIDFKPWQQTSADSG
jgi:hypothetical protein